MSPATKNAALEILRKCTSLDDAEHGLQTLPKASLGMRWGLWDGWSGRRRTLAGVSDKEKYDYLEGCEIGCELSLRNLPG